MENEFDLSEVEGFEDIPGRLNQWLFSTLVAASDDDDRLLREAVATDRPSPAVLESITGLGGPGISSNPSTLLKSNSFFMILEPLILASRVLDD